MDRVINYPGQIPLETDLLRTNRNIMVAIGKMAHALFGASTIVNGLTVTQDTPASMRVAVGPGEIYALANLDSTAYSSLPADTARQVVKQGINLDTTFLTLAAPATAGQSINYLIQATLTEVDLFPTVLPYYNSGNPAVAFSGPNNTGQPQATERDVIVTLSAKAGAAAATGSQQTPSPDANCVGLYVVTVANGQSSITNAHISLFPGAPILPSAGMVRGGFQNNQFSAANAGGTADAITANFNPQVTAAVNGMTLFVRASAANTSTAPTFAPGSLPARAIVKGNNQALSAGDIAGAGHWLCLQYDAQLDRWVLQNPATGVTRVTQQPGEICLFARTTPPSGFLRANGAAVAVASYPALTTAIYCGDANNGTATWGYRCTDSANPSTTRSTTGAFIVLPDYRAEFPRGWDDGRGVDAGRSLWSWQAQEIQAHNHAILTNGQETGTGRITEGGPPNSATYYTENTGGAETRPRNLAALICIKF